MQWLCRLAFQFVLTVDGENRGACPQTMEKLGVGSHQISATLEGYQPAVRTVELAHPGERVMVELALLPVPVPIAEPLMPTPVADAGVKTVAVKPQPKKPPPPAPTGKLTLKTTPWSSVYLGKRKLGDTPLLNVVLPAGKHMLRLVSPESNLENSIEVEIKANETTVKKLKF